MQVFGSCEYLGEFDVKSNANASLTFDVAGYRYLEVLLTNAQGIRNYELIPISILAGVRLENYNPSDGWNFVSLTKISSSTWKINIPTPTSYAITYGLMVNVYGIK